MGIEDAVPLATSDCFSGMHLWQSIGDTPMTNRRLRQHQRSSALQLIWTHDKCKLQMSSICCGAPTNALRLSWMRPGVRDRVLFLFLRNVDFQPTSDCTMNLGTGYYRKQWNQCGSHCLRLGALHISPHSTSCDVNIFRITLEGGSVQDLLRKAEFGPNLLIPPSALLGLHANASGTIRRS